MAHSLNDTSTCRDCGQHIRLGSEKALSGESEMVWVGDAGRWVCEVTGNEHAPGEPRHNFEVTLTFGDKSWMVRLSLAEAGNFVIRPITEALDDGEAAWAMAESDPERLAMLRRWAEGMYGVTG